MESCCAIITAYKANTEILANLLSIIDPGVEQIIVVCNGGDLPALPQKAALIRNGSNVGLGAALNQGIRWSDDRGFSEILLFDQDSNPHRDMVPRLRTALSRLKITEPKIAAVGPSFSDPRSGQNFPFFKLGFWRKRFADCSVEIVETDSLITSGCLIPMNVLRNVGNLDESLFIDCTDAEWCFRALSKGYRLFGVCAARMDHRIGDRIFAIRLPFGRTIHLAIHEPVRLYYIMRNRVLLYSAPHASWKWISSDIVRIPMKFLAFMCFVPQRRRNAAYMLAGLFHGVVGRRGKIPQSLLSAIDRNCDRAER